MRASGVIADGKSATANPKKVPATSALFAYARESDRLMALQLCFAHGALAVYQSIPTGGSLDSALGELKNWLTPTSHRNPHPDEVFLDFHDSLMAEMLATRQVDNFLAYVVQLLGLIFAARPELLRSQEQVRVDFVLSHPDRESLVTALIERRINRLAYLGMCDLDEDLQKRLGFSLFAAGEDREKAVELIEIRNVIVHNRGIVSKIAAARCSALAAELGKAVCLSLDKLTDHRTFFWKLVREIDYRAIEKFGLIRQE